MRCPLPGWRSPLCRPLQAACDAQDCAGRGGGVSGQEPGDGAGDLLGLPGTAHRDVRGNLGGPLRVRVKTGPDGTRGDTVDTNAVRGNLLGQAYSHRVDRGLRCGVVHVLTRAADGRRGRGDTGARGYRESGEHRLRQVLHPGPGPHRPAPGTGRARGPGRPGLPRQGAHRRQPRPPRPGPGPGRRPRRRHPDRHQAGSPRPVRDRRAGHPRPALRPRRPLRARRLRVRLERPVRPDVPPDPRRDRRVRGQPHPAADPRGHGHRPPERLAPRQAAQAQARPGPRDPPHARPRRLQHRRDRRPVQRQQAHRLPVPGAHHRASPAPRRHPGPHPTSPGTTSCSPAALTEGGRPPRARRDPRVLSGARPGHGSCFPPQRAAAACCARSIWQAATVNSAKRPGRRRWLDTARHPRRRDGAMLRAAGGEPRGTATARRNGRKGAGGARGAAAAALSLGALGIVFGDIGTSPLYAVSSIFAVHGVRPDVAGVDGMISLVIWTIVLVVSVKYVTFVMGADNRGEGGIMALVALVLGLRVKGRAGKAALVLLGIFGVALFFGDGTITPAISVIASVEGLGSAQPGLKSFVLPVTLTLLTVLFAGQRFGTQALGRLFGPAMALWFAILAASGLAKVIGIPVILKALSPSYGLAFFLDRSPTGLLALGAIVLVVTGAEALYADLGQFDRPSVTRAWIVVVFPALIINYLGQGAMILRSPKVSTNLFFEMFPRWAQLPMVVVAVAAAMIASQAVISGAFSVTRQAV